MLNSVFRARIRGGVGAKAVANASSRGQSRHVPLFETLEDRRLCSIGHNAVVTHEELIGAEGAITSVVLTFDKHLNAVTADNPAAYAIIRQVYVTSTDSAGLFGSLSPFSSGDTSSTSIVNLHAKIKSAVYNDANMTVTLTTSKPFRADKFFRLVRVAGTGPNAILTSDGRKLDAAGVGKPSNASIYFGAYAARRMVYKDSNGDKVTIKLSGPGQIRMVLPRTGVRNPLVFVVGANPHKSVLFGSVIKAPHGDGVAVIQELSGTSLVKNNLAGNPAFNIETTHP